MRGKIPTHRIAWGYMILIFIAMLEQLFVFLNVYLDQSYTGTEFAFSIAALAALLIGLLLPVGLSVVGVFIFLVSYFVWLATYAKLDILAFSWILLIPANLSIAALIKTTLIRSKIIIERMEELQYRAPQIDLDTTLGNKEALAEIVVKQSNLAKRYAEQYSFCMAMFKIDFLPLVQESLGSQRYAQLLLELSSIIQQQIRYEDYKFSLDRGRFIILCPMTNHDFLQTLTDRIKQALMDIDFLDKKGQPLKLVIRAGAVVFHKEQFSKYKDIDAVIAALERHTETDLIGEYI
ncbi:diguanylate cyclase domain-containing protein [Paenibacillus bouchesdurhonensis]|uniref:diguanylate cyclase domain-containing protein n=1 Tax=Paenibacillus bouchesdurhonensis TaxID=1870990 RepID=UPI000DA5FC1A|nr:diguanylate cyclase [Paenibacillus bouchesdurhonensis]